MSNLLVQNIKHTNGTTSMVVDSSGHVATDTIKGNTTAVLLVLLVKAILQLLIYNRG